MSVQIQLRRDTSSNWATNNPVLAQGEPALETNTNYMKIGDGTTAWNALPYQLTSTPTLPSFNVESYGARGGDAAHDDGPGILAAVQALNASPLGGQLIFPRPVTYYANADNLLTHWADGQYAMFPVPKVATVQTQQKVFSIVGPGPAVVGRNWSGTAFQPTSLLPNQTTAVLQVSYSTAKSYSSSYGWPSVFGCYDSKSAGYYSNVFAHVRGLVIRQPANPSMLALNFERCASAHLEDFMAEGIDPVTVTGGVVAGGYDMTPKPTHPTGGTVLWPAGGNTTILKAGMVGAWGMYAGPGFGEHLTADYLFAVRCRIGHPTVEFLDHTAHIVHTCSEELPFVLAGWDPVAGVVGFHQIKFKIDNLDMEHYKSSVAPNDWCYIKCAIYDPANLGQGVVHSYASDPFGSLGGSVVPGIGGSGIAFYGLLDNQLHTPSGGIAPISDTATVPGAPSVGTASTVPGGISLAFTAPASNGGAPILSYTVTAGGRTATGASSPISVLGLTSGTSYTATVHATNGVGDGPESAASNSATGGTPPALYDSFNRADSTTSVGTPDIGGPWTPGTGATWGLVLSGAYLVGGNVSGGYGTLTAPVTANGTLTSTYYSPSSPDFGYAFRYVDDNNFLFVNIGNSGNGTPPVVSLYNRVSGTFNLLQSGTNIPSGAITTGVPHSVSIACSGTHIVVQIDGTTVIDYTGTTGREAVARAGLVQATAASASRFDSIQWA